MGALIPRLGSIFDRPRVGLYGGSFNPVHAGHGHVAETALRALALDAVVWLVSPGNPLKDPGELADYDARLAATRAMARNTRFYVSDAERQLGTRYTIDTVTALQRLHPRTRFTLVMGADGFAHLHHWKDWKTLMHRVPIAVIARPGWDRAALTSPAAQSTLGTWRFIPAPHHAHASRAIRLAATGKAC